MNLLFLRCSCLAVSHVQPEKDANALCHNIYWYE